MPFKFIFNLGVPPNPHQKKKKKTKKRKLKVLQREGQIKCG